ncbi:MAG: ATP-grasp domain-containing protein, partial [Candidatus Poseidoniales archaeon]
MMRSVLVANRGEIACRVLRACKEAGLRAVSVHAEDEAGAMHTEMSDLSLPLEGSGAPAYLNGDAIIAAALANDVDGIHPGFGFLSERAGFAQAVLDAGLIWIGPSPNAIERMGDKMTARITMREAGVPVIPGEEIEIESSGDEEADLEATLDAVRSASERVGFPLLLKASAGGGGKGMRAVESADGLDEAVRGARREAIAAFGDGRVYLERLLRGARHVEVQVLADAHGRTVHLGERECSVQRRHQKVFEEAPCAVVNEEQRQRMGEAAIAAAEAVDYVGAGTVEFLMEDDGTFHFLEMNTRIQV